MRVSTRLLVLSLTLSAALHAQQVTREFPVPGHGALKLSWPADWVQRTQENNTIQLSDPDGNVTVLITPLWSPKKDAQFNSAENIRKGIAAAAQKIQPTAVEKELTLREISTAAGKGFYFWATDRAPKPGEYEYMANGAVPTSDLLVSFTILTHKAPPDGIAAALAIISSAK